MFIKKYKILFCAFTAIICLSSCGNKTDSEKQLSDFSAYIENFTNTIKMTNEQINNLDTTNPNAPDELLEILDDLAIEFKELSEIPVPDQYKGIEKLADEADTHMAQAVSFYHEAFGNEVFDEQAINMAYFNYTCAMTRVKYIGHILTGEIPEDENVTIIEDNNNSKLLDKLLSDEENTEITSETATDTITE